MKIAGGWTMDRELFSDKARGIFDVAVSHRRLFVALPEEALRGTRFNSDNSILVRVESSCTEAEFVACPGLRIDAALVDAAKSDWWYQNEKDYGSDEMEIVGDDNGE